MNCEYKFMFVLFIVILGFLYVIHDPRITLSSFYTMENEDLKEPFQSNKEDDTSVRRSIGDSLGNPLDRMACRNCFVNEQGTYTCEKCDMSDPMNIRESVEALDKAIEQSIGKPPHLLATFDRVKNNSQNRLHKKHGAVDITINTIEDHISELQEKKNKDIQNINDKIDMMENKKTSLQNKKAKDDIKIGPLSDKYALDHILKMSIMSNGSNMNSNNMKNMNSNNMANMNSYNIDDLSKYTYDALYTYPAGTDYYSVTPTEI